MYYFHIKDEKITGKGQVKCLNAINIEVSQDVYNNSEKYIYQNGEVILDPEYEAKQATKEKERIARLSLTKREVFLGLYQALGVTPDMIKAQITDPAALIEFEYANDYYRGNPLIDVVGLALGITPEQLDKFFEFNDYTYLITDGETPSDEVEGGVA